MNEQFREFVEALNEAVSNMDTSPEDPLHPKPPKSTKKAASSVRKAANPTAAAGAVLMDKKLLQTLLAKQTTDLVKSQGKIEKALTRHEKKLDTLVKSGAKANVLLDKLLKAQIASTNTLKKAFTTPLMSVQEHMNMSLEEDIDPTVNENLARTATRGRRAMKMKGTTESFLHDLTEVSSPIPVLQEEKKQTVVLEEIRDSFEEYFDELLHEADLARDAQREAALEARKAGQQSSAGSIMDHLKGLKDKKDASGSGWIGFALGGVQALFADRIFGGINGALKSVGGIKGLLKNPMGFLRGLKPMLTSFGSMFEGLGGLGSFFKKIPGLSKALGLAKGVGGKLALPITVILGLIDFFVSFLNVGEVLGKAQDKLTIMDRVSAGLGGILGGLIGIIDGVFGLFGLETNIGGTAKSFTAKTFQYLFEYLSQMFRLVFLPVRKGLQILSKLPWKELMAGAEFLMDSVMKPLLGGLTALNNFLDGSGEELDSNVARLKDSFFPFTKSLDTLRNLLDRMARVLGFRSLQSATDYVEFRAEKASAWMRETVSEAVASVANVLFDLKESAKNILVGMGDSVARLFGYDSLEQAFQDTRDAFVSTIRGIGAGVAKLLGFENFDALIDRVTELRDLIMKPFEIILDSFGKFAKGLSKVASWVGYDSKEFEEWEKRKRGSSTKATSEREISQAKQAARQAEGTPGRVKEPPRETQTSAPSGTFIRPLTSKVSSQFGMRNNPFGAQSAEYHKGQDYAGNYGDPVRAASDGVVQIAGYLRGYGNAVYINHDNGYQTRYGHMRSLSPLGVGSRVSAGDIIGEVGSTGRSSGPHLHFEVRRGWSLSNSDTTPVDPEQFFAHSRRDANLAERVPMVRPNRPITSMNAPMPRIGMGESVVTNRPTTISGPMPRGEKPQLNDVAAAAVEIERQTGLPAKVLIAQWAVESGWGKKETGDFNYFGITKGARHKNFKMVDTQEDITWEDLQKFSKDERSTARNLDGSELTPWTGKKKIAMKRKFASYGSLHEAMQDYATMMTKRGNYGTAFERFKLHGNPDQFIQEIAGTYATDRNYGNLVTRVANQRNVQNAIAMASNSPQVPPMLEPSRGTSATVLARATAENGSLQRQSMQGGGRREERNVTIAPATINASTTTIVADLKARNTESTHQRIVNSEHVRT